jgi:hypothetical protein
MPINSFTSSSVTGMTALPTTLNVALPGAPGGPSTALITNLGPGDAFVVLGNSDQVVATVDTGVAVLVDESLPLAIGPTNTHLAAITSEESTPAVLNIALGA